MLTAGTLTPGEALDEVTDSIDQIKTQIDRCSRITAAIPKFGRQGEARMERLDLTQAIPEIIQMVDKKAQVNGIDLVRTLPDRPVWTVADDARLQQVILNLLNNAMDAIGDTLCSGGVITVDLTVDGGNTATVPIRAPLRETIGACHAKAHIDVSRR